MGYITTLAAWLQALFTTTADQLGHETGFIQRQRRLTAAAFAQTLVFQWIGDGTTTLETMARELDLSPQALHQHLSPRAVDFLRQLLIKALEQLLEAKPCQPHLLRPFTATIVEDCSTITLPAELATAFPGCGGGRPAGHQASAALKILLRWNVTTGAILALSVHAGTTSDQSLAAQADDLPAGSLHLADLGFFNSARWRTFPADRYWISRVATGVKVRVGVVWQTLSALLATRTGDGFDGPVGLVESTDLSCRLVALRCPQEVADRRRRKLRDHLRHKCGREPRAAQLVLCDGVVLATNVSAAWLAAREVWLVYRARWQVELFFKRAKSLVRLAESHGRRGVRVLVEMYAKLLGVVVTHGVSLLRGAPLQPVSPWKCWQVVQRGAMRLQDALSQGVAPVAAVLEKLRVQLARIGPQRRGTKRASTWQLLAKPRLAA